MSFPSWLLLCVCVSVCGVKARARALKTIAIFNGLNLVPPVGDGRRAAVGLAAVRHAPLASPRVSAAHPVWQSPTRAWVRVRNGVRGDAY